MNQRIRELAEQTIGTNPKYAVALIMSSPELQQFAELIVQECAKVCYRTGILEQDERTGWVYGDAIQEHFGVE